MAGQAEDGAKGPIPLLAAVDYHLPEARCLPEALLKPITAYQGINLLSAVYECPKRVTGYTQVEVA